VRARYYQRSASGWPLVVESSQLVRQVRDSIRLRTLSRNPLSYVTLESHGNSSLDSAVCPGCILQLWVATESKRRRFGRRRLSRRRTLGNRWAIPGM